MAQELLAKHGDANTAARAIEKQCQGRWGEVPSINAIGIWIRRAAKGELGRQKTLLDKAEADKLNQIKNALDEANIPIESIGKIDHALFTHFP